MTYQQTLEFLFDKLPAYHRIGKAAYKSDLTNAILLDEYFKRPHSQYITIHVAGTNGKGSVSHMLASVLHEAGYKTGLYTSPHLKDFRERIKVNGEMIAENDIVTFIRKNRSIIDSVKPSFFEMTVAMAFNHFAECKVDVAVIETGLGGRLDSTNIICPVLSIITNIGHDHMDLLGNSMEKIAFEKAGIIKWRVPVLISEITKETRKVFELKALEEDSPLVFAENLFSCSLEANPDLRGNRRFLITDLLENSSVEGVTALGGDYQSKNISAVFSAFRILKGSFKVEQKVIIAGIRNVVLNTGLLGRWQILGKAPLTVCDTAHNREGLEYVLNQIKRIKKLELHMIIGFVNDKDLKSVLPLFPQDAHYYFTKASVPRALNERILKSEAENYGLKGECYPDVGTALKFVRSVALENDMIFIGGSTFIVGDII